MTRPAAGLTAEDALAQIVVLAASLRTGSALGGEPAPSAPRSLGEATRLREDLHLDSLQLLTLAIEVEDHFGVALRPQDEAGIETLGDLAVAVAGRLAERGYREDALAGDEA